MYMHEKHHIYFHTFQYFPCNVAHLDSLNIHVLQIKIYYCNVDHTTEKTVLRVINYFGLYFIMTTIKNI
jgi:hypothetical protein